MGVIETKLITPEKIVPYKCCLPNSNISIKKDFYTDFILTNIKHFHGLSVTFIKYGQNVNAQWHLIDKANLGKLVTKDSDKFSK